MAKKQTRPATRKAVQNTDSMVMNEPIVQEKPTKQKNTKADSWEIKDRTYYLTNNKTPLSRSIKASGIYYFDEDLGYERELKYTENQRTVFVDEMKGDQRLSHVIFRNGALFVEKERYYRRTCSRRNGCYGRTSG